MGSGEQAFRDAFPTIAALIDGTGEHAVQVTHSISGDDTIVVVKRFVNGRGWGMVLRDGVLTGMRNHRYDSAMSDTSPSNAAFLAEFERRLAVIGASAIALQGGAGYLMACDDVSARCGGKKYRRRIVPNRTLAKELAAHAF
jgi:hypothetical protein